ncbi:MAG TPA: hypothetical protein PKG52_00410 [bacterium]|nr:hypothetical protein [bacterium]HPS29000.1 hypothetical protein [bacterium]
MEVFSGTIISKRTNGKGFWYSISTHPAAFSFFSRSEVFSLFEKCEITVEKRNNSYFLADFHSFSDIPPLKKNPGNLIAASWLSNLVSSFTASEPRESVFIEKCREALDNEISVEDIFRLENEYLSVSGFGDHDEHEQVLYDCFPYSKRLRESLIKQLSKKRFLK